MATIPVTGKLTVPPGSVTGTFTVNPTSIVGGTGAIIGTVDLTDSTFVGSITFDPIALAAQHYVLIVGNYFTYTMRTSPPPLHMIGGTARTDQLGQTLTCNAPGLGVFGKTSYPCVQLTSGPYSGLYVRTTDTGILFY